MNLTTTQATRERKPADSEISVVLRGDGEPKTPQSILHRLVEFEAQAGIEGDTYSLGGTVEKLERRFAELLGKEAAAFMPTGTLANHLAIRRLCGAKPRAIVQEQCHLYHDTGDCVTRLSGINLIPLAKDRPYFTLAELEQAVIESESGRVANPVGAVMVESPVRRQAGQVMPFGEMEAVTAFCRERGIPTHLDGARLYMMSAATGIRPAEYAALFDTVYVSLYKYFGAPFGAILAGPTEVIGDIFHDRRMFGGGLASASFAAALALQGVQGFEERFARAMRKALELFDLLNTQDGIRVEAFKHGSNIFSLVLAPEVDLESFVSALKQHWVFIFTEEPYRGRPLVAVNTTILRQSNDELARAFEEALAQGKRRR
ncbi:MAG: threonine aldolase family protein [Chloroflexi bacterium]|nr:threonine aldolase family protein [Chloroflexota bacterium]